MFEVLGGCDGIDVHMLGVSLSMCRMTDPAGWV